MRAARYILDKNGLEDILVVEVSGYLTDFYDSKRKRVCLSSSVYHDSSIASVAVACHECGHAIQDKVGYSFLKIRSFFTPIVHFSSYAGYFAILFGIIFGSFPLIFIGIASEILILSFQIITLPVELDASCRALKELDYAHILNSLELRLGKVMLTAAAFTYIASVLAVLLQILRFVLIFRNQEH